MILFTISINKIFSEGKRCPNNLPSCRTMVLTPWKNPRYFGLGCVWSWMNLTLTVSIGQTMRMASLTPAPRPARRRWVCLRLPRSSAMLFFKNSNMENLGVERGKKGHPIRSDTQNNNNFKQVHMKKMREDKQEISSCDVLFSCNSGFSLVMVGNV